MDSLQRGEILSKVSTNVYDVFVETKKSIDSSLMEICSRENVSVNEVFFIFKALKYFPSTAKIIFFKLYHNLRLAVFYYDNQKSILIVDLKC